MGDFKLYLQFFGILILFFIVLYGAYLASKFAARFQNGRLIGRNMTIIEAISVGPQKTLQLVRVGKTYMVVGVSKDNISFLHEVSEDELVLAQEQSSISFGHILKRASVKDTRHQFDADAREEQNESQDR